MSDAIEAHYSTLNSQLSTLDSRLSTPKAYFFLQLARMIISLSVLAMVMALTPVGS